VVCALLHGFAGTPAAWDDVVAAWALPEPPRAIALPGHTGEPVRETWEANLDAVAAAIVGCDVVVGYSMGARVALGLVVTGRCPRGVLISVNPGIADAERARRREDDAGWARMLRTSGLAAFVSAWEAQDLFATQSRVTAEQRTARRRQRMTLDAEQLARSLEVMGLSAMPNYEPAIATHRDRLALIAGADDSKYLAIARRLPVASFESIARSGHDPTLEQPEALAQAIARAVA
jgi:2-succinyl-6-hydroxy-2,4-cyclohexadiene-1-carboxylate synthase